MQQKKKTKESYGIFGGKEAKIFYAVLLIIPILQFCIFYIGVNANSFLLAFQKTDLLTFEKAFTLEHFERLWLETFELSTMGKIIGNSVLLWFISLIISVPLALFFSFYIYKKAFGSGFFKVIVFLPSIISSMVLVLIFKYFVEWGLPMIGVATSSGEDFITNIDTRYGSIIFYNIWIGFGSSMLIYTGAMGQIDESTVEAAQLDGVTMFQEFIYLTLPSVYPTISVFLVTSVASMFNNQASLFNFYGPLCGAEYRTIGYHIFVSVSNGSVNEQSYAAAIGLAGTAIIIPTTFLVRWILDKFDASEV